MCVSVRALEHLGETGAEALRRHPGTVPALLAWLGGCGHITDVGNTTDATIDALGIIGRPALEPLIERLKLSRHSECECTKATRALIKVGCDAKAAEVLIDTLAWRLGHGSMNWYGSGADFTIYVQAVGMTTGGRGPCGRRPCSPAGVRQGSPPRERWPG